MNNQLISNILNQPIEKLLKKANILREQNFAKNIDLCSIVNAKSGRCSEDCLYCAQSTHYKTDSQCYPLMDIESIYHEAEKIKNTKISNFSIVTSGPKLSKQDFSNICKAIIKIKSDNRVNICASLGALTIDELIELKHSGLDRYHHNLETSKNFYPNICSTHSWEDRYKVVLNSLKVGLKVCSGGLFGLGETWKDRIDLAYTLGKLELDSVPINFLSPIPGTPLARKKILDKEEALRIIILYRFLLPNKTIRICGGRPTVLKEMQNLIYSAGANAIMTGNYLTTMGIDYNTDITLIKENGFEVNMNCAFKLLNSVLF